MKAVGPPAPVELVEGPALRPRLLLGAGILLPAALREPQRLVRAHLKQD